jgi:hypothetical protein
VAVPLVMPETSEKPVAIAPHWSQLIPRQYNPEKDMLEFDYDKEIHSPVEISLFLKVAMRYFWQKIVLLKMQNGGLGQILYQAKHVPVNLSKILALSAIFSPFRNR